MAQADRDTTNAPNTSFFAWWCGYDVIGQIRTLYKLSFQTSELTHELLEEQNVNQEVSEQLATETKEKLKLKENLQFEKERADELEKVRERIFCVCCEKKHFLENVEEQNTGELQWFFLCN